MRNKQTRFFAADDWGLSPAINAGILQLAERGWLRSVSLMANAPFLGTYLPELLMHMHHGLQFSLHLNFTYGRPLAPPLDVASLTEPSSGNFFSHRRLILRGFSRRLHPTHVIREFQAQLDRLRELEIPVSGIDGHHHVHLLPGVAGPLHHALLRNGLTRSRMMSDHGHQASYLQTLIFKNFIAPRDSQVHFENCRYLLPSDLRSAKSFRRKIQASGTAPLLVHPALYNDFAESGMCDQMQDARVHELETIVRYLND
ncbi:MAG: ChbG/HpnK family deacetylase [Bdellovibrionales bacterium]